MIFIKKPLTQGIIVSVLLLQTVPALSNEVFDTDKDTSCLAIKSSDTSNISIPCVKVDTDPDNMYSVNLISESKDEQFSIGKIRKLLTDASFLCEAKYNVDTQLLNIPCILDEDSEGVYSVTLTYNGKNLSLENENSSFSRGKTYVNLPDTGYIYNLMSSYGGSGWICRKARIQISDETTVKVKTYTETGQYYGYKPRFDKFHLYLYRDVLGRDPLIASTSKYSANYGNTLNFTLATNVPKGNYYWCLSGLLNYGSVKLYK